MTELLSLLTGGSPFAIAAVVIGIAPWAFILTARLVPRSLLDRADRDRDKALAAVDKMLEARTVDSDRLGDIERSLRVVEQFINSLPHPAPEGGTARDRERRRTA